MVLAESGTARVSEAIGMRERDTSTITSKCGALSDIDKIQKV